jgi:hypothetical protein
MIPPFLRRLLGLPLPPTESVRSSLAIRVPPNHCVACWCQHETSPTYSEIEMRPPFRRRLLGPPLPPT